MDFFCGWVSLEIVVRFVFCFISLFFCSIWLGASSLYVLFVVWAGWVLVFCILASTRIAFIGIEYALEHSDNWVGLYLSWTS